MLLKQYLSKTSTILLEELNNLLKPDETVTPGFALLTNDNISYKEISKGGYFEIDYFEVEFNVSIYPPIPFIKEVSKIRELQHTFKRNLIIEFNVPCDFLLNIHPELEDDMVKTITPDLFGDVLIKAEKQFKGMFNELKYRLTKILSELLLSYFLDIFFQTKHTTE